MQIAAARLRRPGSSARIAARVAVHQSPAACSCQPGRGRCIASGAEADPSAEPLASNSTAFEPVVEQSIASTSRSSVTGSRYRWPGAHGRVDSGRQVHSPPNSAR